MLDRVFMGGPMESRLDKSWHSWVRRWVRMGSYRNEYVCITRSIALRRHNTGKLSKDCIV